MTSLACWSSVDGELHLAYRWRTKNEVIRVNGRQAGWGWGIYGGADYIHWSYAAILPRVPGSSVDVGPPMV